jgi:hypothetical protein
MLRTVKNRVQARLPNPKPTANRQNQNTNIKEKIRTKVVGRLWAGLKL